MRRALLLLAACQASSATTEPPPSERFERDMIVRFHMHENFDLLRTIEKLLVRGRLDEAKALARAIAEAPDEPGLEPWAKQAVVVRERAAALANAKDAVDACRLEARLAEACAGCHAEAGVIPEFRSSRRTPPDQPTIEARMARHLWATDRLWEGIVGAADESWREGLDVLASAPLQAPQIAGERIAFARQLQWQADQARRTQRTDTLADRARAYGEMLATCTGCHAARSERSAAR